MNGTHLGQVRLERPSGDEGVGVLDRNHSGKVELLREPDEFHDAIGRLVRHADVANFSGVDDVLHALELLLEGDGVPLLLLVVLLGAEERHVPVGPVDLQEVDVVRPEPREDLVDALLDVGLRDANDAIVAQVRHPFGLARDLRRDDEVLPPLVLKPGPNVPLGQALGLLLARDGVHLSGIHEVHPAVERVAQLLVSLGLCVLLPPGHGAKANLWNDEVAFAELAQLWRVGGGDGCRSRGTRPPRRSSPVQRGDSRTQHVARCESLGRSRSAVLDFALQDSQPQTKSISALISDPFGKIGSVVQQGAGK